MNNLQIESYLSLYGVKVICADELPAFLQKRPAAYVVNTDRCGLPGKHWTVFYFPRKGNVCEFFDSLGQTPEHYHNRFRQVLVANGPKYRYVKHRLQALDSDVCGQYCIYYIVQRGSGRTMMGICNDFFIDKHHLNDAFVSLFTNAL